CPIVAGTSGALKNATPDKPTDDSVTESTLQIATDHPPAAVQVGDSVYLAFKRNKKHILGIAQSPVSPATDWSTFKIPNTGKAVDHHGISAGDDWVITNRAPALASAVVGTTPHLFLAFGGNGSASLWLGNCAHPATA